MTDRERVKAGEAVRQIRRLLGDWLRTSSESREPVADILQLLEVVDEFVQQDRSKRGAKEKPAGGRESGATYSIDKKKNEEEVLTEHRAGGSSQPFRCPKYVYEAVVSTLSKAEEPADFAEIMQGVAKSVPDPAEFQVRAALRFMLSVTPPMVARDRSRYRPMHGGKFQTEGATAWAALAKATKKGV
jgi:hypothetical protein